MGSHNPPKFIVYCVACGVVEERFLNQPSDFEAFEVVLAWNREHAVVWSARCRRCGMSASVREQPG